ncbi:MAG: caspase family protein [Myxococcaceae bacterium]|nr:caspase family protein [Myxococcaceae bacterium]
MRPALPILPFLPGLALLLALVPQAASAGSNMRYALVVGNDHAGGEPDLEPLQHAERDAAALAEQLVRLGNFQKERVELVTGADRRAVLAAAQRLALRHRQDEAELGPVPALFAFFFTGHGLSGRLLTADGPLTGEDLAHVFTEMGAHLSLGFVDACYAGSLDWDSLKAKGATVTPGFNPITELPREVLEAEGMMWFVSSQSGELSYEDRELGGLFTHFLLEGFTAAPQDGVGVSLENLWEYARQHTSTFAARHGRRQSPERIVRQLKSRSPTYLSFPRARSASLVLDASLEGSFLLQYEQAALVEKITKPAGQPLEVKAYEGDVVLSRVAAAGGPIAAQRLKLEPGSRVAVRPAALKAERNAVGFTEESIRTKGATAGLAFAERRAQTVLAVGGGYRWALPTPNLLGAMHTGGLHVQVLHGHFSLDLSLATGSASERFEAWSYRAQQISGEVSAAYGLNLGPVRLELEVSGGPRVWLVEYGDGGRKSPGGGFAGGGLRAHLSLPFDRPWVLLQARGGYGVAFAPATTSSDRLTYVTGMPVFEAGIAVPFFLD